MSSFPAPFQCYRTIALFFLDFAVSCLQHVGFVCVWTAFSHKPFDHCHLEIHNLNSTSSTFVVCILLLYSLFQPYVQMWQCKQARSDPADTIARLVEVKEMRPAMDYVSICLSSAMECKDELRAITPDPWWLKHCREEFCDTFHLMDWHYSCPRQWFTNSKYFFYNFIIIILNTDFCKK